MLIPCDPDGVFQAGSSETAKLVALWGSRRQNCSLSAPFEHALGRRATFTYRSRLLFHPTVSPKGIAHADLTSTRLSWDDASTLDAADQYLVRLPSTLGDVTSPRITRSVSTCALIASNFSERLQLVVSAQGRVVSFVYTVPNAPTECGRSKVAQRAELPQFNATIELLDANEWCAQRADSVQVFLLSEAARCVYAVTKPYSGMNTWAYLASHTP